MKNSVILKSSSSGISVILDDTIPYGELLEDIAAKFRETDSFFKNASVAIALKGRELTDEQVREILDVISGNSRLNILCLIGEEEKIEEETTKIQEEQEEQETQKDENCGLFYKGTLKNGQSIETERSIVIIGDVYEGCSVYSAGDIVILGTLAGEAYAGAGGNSNHFVAALDMSPSLLRIGDFSLRPDAEHIPIWKLKQKPVPKLAYICNKKILVEPITKELLKSINS